MIKKQELINALTELLQFFSETDIKPLRNWLDEELNRFGRNAQPEIKFSSLGDIFLALAHKLQTCDKSELAMNTKVMDQWARILVGKIPLKDLKSNPGLASDLLSVAIKNNLSTLSAFLVENGVGVDADFFHQSGEKHYRALFYVLEDSRGFDKSLFDKLLATVENINHVSSYGQTALYLAVEQGNQYAIDKLLERDDIQIKGRHFNLTLFDLAKRDPSLYKKLVDKLNKQFDPDSYDWSELIEFPIAELNQDHQTKLLNKLLKKIDQLEIFEDKELKNAFLDFLYDPTPLPCKRLNRLAIAFECVSYLVNYDWINQHNTNLCGTAVLMQHLAASQPNVFIHSVIEMATLGLKNASPPKYLPSRVKSLTKENLDLSYNLASFWMEGIRHGYNTVFGYSSQSKLEKFYGLTSPYQLELMFKEFKLGIVEESFQIRIDPRLRFSSLFEGVRGLIANYGFLPAPLKFYGSKHAEIQDDHKRFETLMNWSSAHPKDMICILIDFNLLNVLFNCVKEDGGRSLGCEETHFLNVTNLSLSNDGKSLSLSFTTYGNKQEAKNIRTDDFIKGYRGALLIMPPALTNELDTKKSSKLIQNL